MKRKKILFASFDKVPSPKGAGVHISQFVAELALHYNVTLVTPDRENSISEYLGARHHKIEVNGENFLKDTDSFRCGVKKLLESNHFDIVHFRNIWEGLPVSQLKQIKKYKTIYEVNGLPSIELKYHYPGVMKDKTLIEKFSALETALLIESDVIIVPSNVTKKFLLEKGVLERKITVIPNGVDTVIFQPAPKPPHPPVRFIYLGTLTPWQGLEHLLEAFKRASRTCDIRLTIVGKSRKDWLKSLTKTVRKLKIAELVIFGEAVNHEEVPSILNRHHVGVAPFTATERNTKQGFCPIKVLEYMACGLAVIASDLPSVRELVENEKEAVLYKPNNTNRLADAIIRVAEDEKLRRRLAEGCVQKAQNFSWRESRRKLMQIYENLL